MQESGRQGVYWSLICPMRIPVPCRGGEWVPIRVCSRGLGPGPKAPPSILHALHGLKICNHKEKKTMKAHSMETFRVGKPRSACDSPFQHSSWWLSPCSSADPVAAPSELDGQCPPLRRRDAASPELQPPFMLPDLYVLNVLVTAI